MFQRLFNLDAPFWVAVSRVADLVWLNVLFVVTSLPLVTVGASLCALYDTAWRLGEEKGGSVTREYLGSFKENFWTGTGLWGIFLPVGAALAASWIFVPTAELAILKTLFSAVYLIIFPFPWFLQTRFQNSFWGTLKNSFLIPMIRLPLALGIVTINGVILGLAIWTVIDLPQIVPLFLLVGFALPVAATIPLLNRTISLWMTPRAN